MHHSKSKANRRITLAILLALFLSPAILQGCDALADEEYINTSEPQVLASNSNNTISKLRFPEHLSLSGDAAGAAGKNTETGSVHLLVGMKEDEQGFSGYDVTRRRLNKYEDGITFKLELDYILNVFAMEVKAYMLDEVLLDLQNDPDIAWIEPDVVLSGAPLSRASSQLWGQHIPWGVEHVNAALSSVQDVEIYIMDSGINASTDINLASSTDFVAPYLTRIGAALPVGNTLLGLTSGLNHLLAPDLVGHGTHIAGTIAAKNNRMGVRGVVPGSSLHNIRVLGPDGQTDMSTLLSAIDYVAQQKLARPHKPMVVNISIGADFGTSEYNALDRAIQRSIDLGIVYIIAAGNDAIDASTVTPAHVRDAITIGSHDEHNRASSFSNYGPAIDLYAPGQDIVSLSHLSARKRAMGSGTSYAAPHVTGIVARYLSEHPSASPHEVQRALVENAMSDVDTAISGTTALRAIDF